MLLPGLLPVIAAGHAEPALPNLHSVEGSGIKQWGSCAADNKLSDSVYDSCITQASIDYCTVAVCFVQLPLCAARLSCNHNRHKHTCCGSFCCCLLQGHELS